MVFNRNIDKMWKVIRKKWVFQFFSFILMFNIPKFRKPFHQRFQTVKRFFLTTSVCVELLKVSLNTTVIPDKKHYLSSPLYMVKISLVRHFHTNGVTSPFDLYISYMTLHFLYDSTSPFSSCVQIWIFRIFQRYWQKYIHNVNNIEK